MKKLFAVVLLSCLCFGLAQAQGSEDLRKQQAEIQKEIDNLKKTLDATRKNKKAGLGQLALVQKKLRLRERAIANINNQIDMIQGTISKSRQEIINIRRELDTLKLQYEKSVQYAYKNRSNYDFLNFVFSAASFNDALKRVEYLKTYRSYRQQQAENIRNTDLLLQQKIASLEITRKEKDEILQKQEKEKQVLVDERREKDEVVSKLKAREKEINKEITAKARADKKLKDGIAAAVRREMEKARLAEAAARKKEVTAGTNATKPGTSPAKTTGPTATKPKSVLEATPEGAIISADFEKNKGNLSWPIEKGNIKIHFGYYSIEGTSLKGNNPGLTLETDLGGVVKSVFAGEVSSVFDIDGSSSVLIKHGKYFTAYGNLSAATVSKGQKISAGQVIGRASSNDDGFGEIEFVLMLENKNLNPEPWIKQR